MKKRILLFLVCGALCLTFAAGCGKVSYSQNSVVVYFEYNGSLGTENDAVRQALEQKFHEDTGESISLEVEVYGSGDAASKFSNAIDASSRDRIDAFVFHYTSDGPLTGAITGGEAKDLTELARQYAPEYLAYYNDDRYDKGGLSYYSGVYDGKLYGLSSAEHTSAWAILVNKNMMANTSFDPEEYDVAGENYKSLTTGEFLQLARELKENNPSVTRTIQGMSWELDNVLAPAFGTVKYNEKVLEDGNLVPSYSTEEYLEYMKYLRVLQGEKLWIENPSSTTADTLQGFISGKGAIYLGWPEVSAQAETANLLKKTNGNGCIVLAPLIADGKDVTNGYLRQYSAYMGLIVPHKGENTELLLKYINWLYSDVENYELAKYGVKGAHWVEREENGVRMWDYPEEKKAEYEAAKPYTGVYCLIENIHVSDRIYAGYTAQQKSWIQTIRALSSYPQNGFATEGVLLPTVAESKNRELFLANSGHSKDYTNMITKAWSGTDYVAGDDSALVSLWETLRTNLLGEGPSHAGQKYYALVEYNTQNYNKILNSRKKESLS